jgi:hypothetical protein
MPRSYLPLMAGPRRLGRCQDAEQHREEGFHDEPQTAAALAVSMLPVRNRAFELAAKQRSQ